MRLPGGAVTPAMKPTTGFFMCSLIQRAQVSSSSPPISPTMITASVSGIVVEQPHDVDVLQAVDRIAADADAGRLSEPQVHQLADRLVGERAGTRHDADAALLVDVPGHDADLDLIRA